MTEVTQIAFYANEYTELHLAPDVYDIDDFETDAEVTRQALDILAKRIGVKRGLIKLASATDDVTDVLVTDRIGGDWAKRGEIEFISA